VAFLRRDERIAVLGRVPLLHRLSKRDLGKVAAMAEERDVEPGCELVREGDAGREFFIVIGGRVEVRRQNRKIAEIGPGGFFGEIALLTERPRNATVSSLAPTRVLVLRSDQFKSLLQQNAPMTVRIIEVLAERTPSAVTD
jgi:CRP-like cAMP-binding protein